MVWTNTRNASHWTKGIVSIDDLARIIHESGVECDWSHE